MILFLSCNFFYYITAVSSQSAETVIMILLQLSLCSRGPLLFFFRNLENVEL
jgi:hypothetical protein